MLLCNSNKNICYCLQWHNGADKMVNLKEFLEKESIEIGGFDKFPQGDTFIDLENTEIVKEDKKNTVEVTIPNGKELHNIYDKVTEYNNDIVSTLLVWRNK
jgi:hypothetical protein